MGGLTAKRSLSPMPVLSALFTFLAGSFRSRTALQIEIVALRHQLNVLQRWVNDQSFRVSGFGDRLRNYELGLSLVFSLSRIRTRNNSCGQFHLPPPISRNPLHFTPQLAAILGWVTAFFVFFPLAYQ